jgi:hypothetical protein
MFTSEEWMALAAQFHLENFPGGAGGKSVATRANHFSIIVFGMNLLFHSYSE